jgi:hypothetical protein
VSVSADEREKAWKAYRERVTRYVERADFEAGWDARWSGRSARPAREDLAAALLDAERRETSFHHSMLYHLGVADALLAADHLWTEQSAADCPDCVALGSLCALHDDPLPERDPALSAPVVDREALAEAIVEQLATIGERGYLRAVLDGIDAAHVGDQATVEREAAAKALEALTGESMDLRRNVELIERAAEYREGKR